MKLDHELTLEAIDAGAREHRRTRGVTFAEFRQVFNRKRLGTARLGPDRARRYLYELGARPLRSGVEVDLVDGGPYVFRSGGTAGRVALYRLTGAGRDAVERIHHRRAIAERRVRP